MTENQLMGFLKVVQANASIEEKLKQASDAEALAIAEIVKEAGFDVPVEDLKVRGYWWKQLPQ